MKAWSSDFSHLLSGEKKGAGLTLALGTLLVCTVFGNSCLE